MSSQPTVFVIDGDAATRNEVREVASSMNLACSTYATGREFFENFSDFHPGCLVLEVRIPDTSGLQIQQRLVANEATLPLIFLSAHADVSLAVELMRGGALNYLQKPIRPVELWNAIQEAVAVDEWRRRVHHRNQRLLQGMATLSEKEKKVLRMVAQGKSNEAMAADLNLALRTIELHRARLMRKLRLKSMVGLLHFALLAFPNGRQLLDGFRSPAMSAHRGQQTPPNELQQTGSGL